MNTMPDYFAWFDLPRQFFLESTLLKQKFFALSRTHHPDFFTQSDDGAQQNALENSVFNTQAFKTLSDFDARTKYILALENILTEENKNALPPDFLMDMMDFNDDIEEAKSNNNSAHLETLKNKLTALENECLEEIKPVMQRYDADNTQAKNLDSVKLFYLKKRYLWRLKQNLAGSEVEL